MNYNNNGNSRYGNNQNRYDNGYHGRPQQGYNQGYARPQQGAYQGQPRPYPNQGGQGYAQPQYGAPRPGYAPQGGPGYATQGGQGYGRPQRPVGNRFGAGRGGYQGRPNKPKFNKPRPKTAAELKKEVAKLAREARIEATYEAVNKAFPQAFNKFDIKPLPVDVHNLLFAHFKVEEVGSDSPVRKSALRVFLSKYIRSNNYNLACLKYKQRFNLDGTVLCDLTESELEYHKSKIKVPTQRPKKPAPRNFNPRFNQAGRPAPRPGYNPRGATPRASGRSYFQPGMEVELMNGKRGVIKEILGDKIKVQLVEGAATITLNSFQLKVVR